MLELVSVISKMFRLRTEFVMVLLSLEGWKHQVLTEEKLNEITAKLDYAPEKSARYLTWEISYQVSCLLCFSKISV
jgi:hypothetical protein